MQWNKRGKYLFFLLFLISIIFNIFAVFMCFFVVSKEIMKNDLFFITWWKRWRWNVYSVRGKCWYVLTCRR